MWHQYLHDTFFRWFLYCQCHYLIFYYLISIGCKVQKCFLSGAALTDALEKEIENGFLYKREDRFNNVVYRVNQERVNAILPGLDIETLDTGDVPDEASSEDDGSVSAGRTPMKYGLVFNVKHLFTAINEHISKGYKGASSNAIKDILTQKGIDHTESYISTCLSDCLSKGFIEAHSDDVDDQTLYSLTPLLNSDPDISGDRKCLLQVTSDNVADDILKKLDVVTSSLEQYQKMNAQSHSTNTATTLPLRPPSKRRVSFLLGCFSFLLK